MGPAEEEVDVYRAVDCKCEMYKVAMPCRIERCLNRGLRELSLVYDNFQSIRVGKRCYWNCHVRVADNPMRSVSGEVNHASR